ncbi:MAG: hypothetical protein L0Z62_42810 [Gemmataceae bacterium]|nr:hypothetical protein [Gemmataceae bacterium]
MTEAEWFVCCDPRLMLAFLEGKASERKLRLFVCACLRRIWSRMRWFHRLGMWWGTRDRVLKAVTVAERVVAGLPIRDKREAGRRWCNIIGFPFHGPPVLFTTFSALYALFLEDERAALTAVQAAEEETPRRQRSAELAALADLLREIIGNPFCPETIDAGWRTPPVVAIAQTVFEEGQWRDYCILADALEEASCTSADLLGHLRSGGEHVRGCWALDAILGKT